jgi:hypothetical protein
MPISVGGQVRSISDPVMVSTDSLSQAFVSVLIIHQVAIGRAFSAKQNEEISRLMIEEKASNELEVMVSSPTIQ